MDTLAGGNVLDYMDESFFLDFRAEGHGPLIQFTWIYDHDVDLDALRRFQQNLGNGLMGRCIERSPLPFGRNRWIRWAPPTELGIASVARPRREIAAWTHEQAAIPIDPESGPPWRMAVQPLIEGGAVVTLLAAHTVIDGVGMTTAVADAVNGVVWDLGYPRAHSRTTTQALLNDAREAVRSLPAVAKALIAVPFAARGLGGHMRARSGRTKEVVRRERDGASLVRHDGGAPSPSAVTIPSVTIRADCRHWDERAAALGGTSNSLFLGIAARLCEILRWVDDDGQANFTVPVNAREPGDTRGNALTGVQLALDPSSVTADLRGVRAGLKAALSMLGEARTRLEAPLPLIPFVPSFASHRFQGVLLNSANLTCSNLGDVDPAVNRPDGTDAERFSVRFTRMAGQLDAGFLRWSGGLFFPVCAGRINGSVFITMSYVAADGSTTTAQFSTTVRRVLDEFGVTASVE